MWSHSGGTTVVESWIDVDLLPFKEPPTHIKERLAGPRDYGCYPEGCEG